MRFSGRRHSATSPLMTNETPAVTASAIVAALLSSWSLVSTSRLAMAQSARASAAAAAREMTRALNPGGRPGRVR